MAIQFEDFVEAIEPWHRAFVLNTHELLMTAGYKLKIEDKASGLFASYSHPKTKRSLLNFLFRKSGMLTRLYPGRVDGGIPDNLTPLMEKEIDKAPACKLCSEKCTKGYKFSIRGQAYDKCRYNAFLFTVTEENKPILSGWIQKEAEQ